MVGTIILFSSKSDNMTSPEIASFVAQSSFASLYLINSFSSLLALAEPFSEICGLSRRVVQLLSSSATKPTSSRDSVIYVHNIIDDWLDNFNARSEAILRPSWPLDTCCGIQSSSVFGSIPRMAHTSQAAESRPTSSILETIAYGPKFGRPTEKYARDNSNNDDYMYAALNNERLDADIPVDNMCLPRPIASFNQYSVELSSLDSICDGRN